MDFEISKSKVYIQTDTDGRVLRCEGGYTTPADLTDWIEIDEGEGDRYNLCQSHYFDGGLYTLDGIPRYKWEGSQVIARTEEEIEIDRQPSEEELANAARAKRDKLLAETDWTQVLDAPIDAQTKEAYRVYRQALRDIPQQEGFPYEIEWATPPDKVKANPDPVDDAVEVILSGATEDSTEIAEDIPADEEAMNEAVNEESGVSV